MLYGSGRLIDVREGVNLRRSFDAARLLLRLGDWSVDGFWSKPVLNRPGVFDDIPYPNLSLWGVYAVRPLAWLPDGHTDLYYLGYVNTHATFDKATPELSTAYELRILWGRGCGAIRCHGSTMSKPSGSLAGSGGNIEAWGDRLGDSVQLRQAAASPPRRTGG